MGSYINVGMISTEEKENFIISTMKFINLLNNFKIILVKYPADVDYSSWVECNEDECGIHDALEYCYKNNMAEIKCNFKIEKYCLQNVLIRVNHIKNNANCILLEIPEENDIFKDINLAENIILSIISDASCLGFKYAFCDSEAEAPQILSEKIKDKYSIFVKFEHGIETTLAPWKIDGFSDR